MSTRIHAHQAAVLVAAFVVSACSGSPITASQVPSLAATSPAPSSSAAPSPAPSGTPATPAEVVLRVTTEGGFIGPAARLAQLPEVVVYADGRILTPAPAPAIYPGPLVPVESVRDVGAAGVAAIRAAITAAGLDAGGGTSPGIGADAADTVFAARVGDQTVTTRFPALGGGSRPGVGQPGSSADPRRAAAETLLSRLVATTEPWGGQVAPVVAYVPTGYRVFVAPGAPTGSDTMTPGQPAAWPLPTPLASFGRLVQPDRGITGLRVGVVTEADAAKLAPVLAAANQLTAFTSGGASFTLYVSPLLPDELAP